MHDRGWEITGFACRWCLLDLAGVTILVGSWMGLRGAGPVAGGLRAAVVPADGHNIGAYQTGGHNIGAHQADPAAAVTFIPYIMWL